MQASAFGNGKPVLVMLGYRLTRCAVAFLSGLAAAGLVLSSGVVPAAGAAILSSNGSTAAQAAQLKVVSYQGYRFEVPVSWPVLRLARHPATCVRFDLHAVYLGRPGANQDCPSWLLGATESVLIEPGPGSARTVSRENPVAAQITASAPRISVTATFDTDPTTIYRLLASAGLAAPSITLPNPGSGGETGAADSSGSGGGHAGGAGGGQAGPLAVSAVRDDTRAAGAAGVGYPALPASVANLVGLGFDVCAAPSSSYMRAWRRHSPYHAVGIYIGGADRACDQQNLTARWVRQQAAAGWRFIPMYAGPQASFGQLSSPARQGASAAKDAVVQAQRLGFGPRTPLYYDMEAYKPKETGKAMRFLSAWTTELHRLGYRSGVYSSSDSAIVDLARQYSAHKFAMPDTIYDALWNGSRNVSDSVYKRGEWGGRRLHQFSGDVVQSYGGDRLEIDQDYLDVSLPNPGGTSQASAAVTSSSGAVAAFYQGSGHHLWEESSTGSGSFSRTDLGGYLTAAPTAVQVNSGTIDVFYRGRGDVLHERTHSSSGWQAGRSLGQMGQVGSPHAVAQPNGVIDVFWKGTHDVHLWHAQYGPGKGWSGPQKLGGSLSSAPYPVETTSGQVQVFWKGTNGNLWRVVRNLGSAWSGARNLGMRTLGGPPHAVALGNGDIDVFWEGSTSPHAIWSAEVRPGLPTLGPVKRGGVIVGQPWPTVTSGSERVMFRSTGGRLFSLGRASSGRWGSPAAVTGAKSLRAAPFAATSAGGSILQLFWTDAKSRLWTIRLTQPGGWGTPADLGDV